MHEAGESSNGNGNGTEDFGAYIPGARKEQAARELDRGIRTDPGFRKTLTESWPTPNWRKLFEDHSRNNRPRRELACIRALRDELRTANGRYYERGVIRARTDPETSLRNLGLRLIEGEIEPEEALSELGGQSPKTGERCRRRATLYRELGHDKDLSAYICARDESNWLVYSPRRTDRASGQGETLIEAAKDLAGKINSEATSPAAATTKKRACFHLRCRTSEGVKHYGIWRNSSVGLVCAQEYDDLDAARTALDKQGPELDAWWERWRKIPDERKRSNEPRTPLGTNETNEPDEFTARFGFRGVQFGNWVEETRRQNDLTDTSQALFDLASVLGWEEASLSLGRRLALAFGARGKGGRAGVRAHYETDQRVIAISKTLGPGTLAHEWFHGLDHNTAVGSEVYAQSFATEGARNAKTTGRLKPLADALAEYGCAVRGGDMRRRERALAPPSPQGKAVRGAPRAGVGRRGGGGAPARGAARARRRRPKSKPYWSTTRELAARGFEAWIVRRLGLDGVKNDYLANVRPAEAWEAAAGPDQGYPYPYANELMRLEPHILKIAAAGRELQTHWGD